MGTTSVQTSFLRKSGRFVYSFDGHKSQQNARQEPECLHDAPAAVSTGPEIHSYDNRDLCEIRFASPFQPDFGGFHLRAERLLGESGLCPCARITAPPGPAAVFPAPPTDRLP